MYAELILHAKRDLPKNLKTALSARFSSEDNIRAAVDATAAWKGVYEWEAQIVFAHRSNNMVFLVFSPEVRTLRVEIESSVDKNDLRQLRKCVEEVVNRLEAFMRHQRNKIMDLTVAIYLEKYQLQTGTRLSWWTRLKESVVEDLLAKVYVPAATFLASIYLGYDVAKAGFNVLAAIGALVLWVVISATVVKESFRYTES